MKKLLVLLYMLCGAAIAAPQYTIISPFPPGLNNMVILQAIPNLNTVTGFEFHQEYFAGAGGVIATNSFLNNKDPNRLLVGTQNVITINPYFNKDTKYTRADFKPVALVGENYMCLIASDKLNVSTFDELVKVAREQPLFYGTNSGVNSMEHVLFQYMAIKYKLKLESIHHKGAVESQLSVSKGDTALALLPAPMCRTAAPNRVVIGYTSPHEKQSLPTDVHISAYMAILAPKETSPEQLKILANGFATVWNENREVLNRLVIPPKTILTGKELDKYLEEQDDKWQKYFKLISSQK